MSHPDTLRNHIEKIEEAYEYMLAYAAQGRADEGAGPDGAHIRDFLRQFVEALGEITESLKTVVEDDEDTAEFIRAFRHDCAVITSVLSIVLARDNVSSEVIDNTNGLISIRSCLTNLFFLDKAVLA